MSNIKEQLLSLWHRYELNGLDVEGNPFRNPNSVAPTDAIVGVLNAHAVIKGLEEALRISHKALDKCIEELRPYAFVYDCGMMDEDNNYPVLEAIQKAEEALAAIDEAMEE